MINLGQVRRFARHVNVDHARKFGEHMVPHVIRPAQIIWNKVIGLIFLVLAAEAFSQAYKFYRLLGSDSKAIVGLFIALLFGIPMLCFGVSSFMRARKLSNRLSGKVPSR